MLERRVDVEEDDHPVVEAGPPDVPLVDECAGARFGLRRVDAVVGQLAVDHDLGAGPRLDAVDDRLRPDDRVGAQDPGEVVDRPVRLWVGEGRARRRSGGGGLAGVHGRIEGRLEDMAERDEDGAVDVAAPEQRHHLVVEDRLSRIGVEVGRLEAVAGVQLDLPVFEARVELEQDDQAVVDAGLPDAPFVHQRAGVRGGFVGREVVAAHRLRVDHDLDPGLGLDRVDDLLGLGDGLGLEHTGVVVDRLVVDGLRVGRPRRRRAW